MNVGDIMTREPITVSENTPLDIVSGLMVDNRVGCIPVVDGDRGLCGIITEADFTGNERNIPFGALMMPHLFDAPPDMEQIDLVRTQARQMTAARIMCSRSRPSRKKRHSEPLSVCW